MQTNFFSLIQQMELSGTLKIVIAKAEDGAMVVSVLLNNEQCTDKAQRQIKPFNLTADPKELDNQFFQSITEPMQQTSSLLTNMKNYMDGLEDAKAKSSMEKDKQVKETKVLNAKEKKYKDLLDQSKKLEVIGKFREAWTKLPDPMEYPEQAEEIRNRRQALSEKFSPDLFAAVSEPAAPFPVKVTEPEAELAEEPEDLEYNEYSGLETDDEQPF